MIALRPSGDGRIQHYEGTQILEELADCVIDAHLPRPGSVTQGVEAGYMANAWVRLQHPDYDELRGLMTRVGETLKVHAS